MKNLVFVLLIIFTVMSCSPKRPVANSDELLKADLAFSDYSLKHGFHQAFITYAHDSVVLLKPDRMPIAGKPELIKSYEGKSDSGLVLTWKPAKAILAASGELGVTYGFWMLVASKDTSEGTYLTVWKRNSSGEWKFIADTGNDGLGK